MPEIRFRIIWPDGSAESAYSPSLVVKDYFNPGVGYSIAEFLELSRTSFSIASERVRAKYGTPCARALAQLARIEAACKRFEQIAEARVNVDEFEE